jgi:hypothetical protein
MKTSLHRAATSQHQAAGPQRRPRPRVNNRPHPKTPSSGQHPRRRFLALTVGAAALPAISRIAWAQSYPTRPITIMVSFVPGGASDAIARNLAERMKVSLGQPVVIENVTGAGGTVGTGRVARARSDGYIIDLGNNLTHVTTARRMPCNTMWSTILSQLH